MLDKQNNLKKVTFSNEPLVGNYSICKQVWDIPTPFLF